MSKVYNTTLLEEMVRQLSLPKQQVKQAAEEILELVREGLVRDGVVNISNFGSFRLKPVAERHGVNPQTREAIIIPAHYRVIFSPCKALREAIAPADRPVVPLTDSKLTTPVHVEITEPHKEVVNEPAQHTASAESRTNLNASTASAVTREETAEEVRLPPEPATETSATTTDPIVTGTAQEPENPLENQEYKVENSSRVEPATPASMQPPEQGHFTKNQAALLLVVLVCTGLFIEFEVENSTRKVPQPISESVSTPQLTSTLPVVSSTDSAAKTPIPSAAPESSANEASLGTYKVPPLVVASDQGDTGKAAILTPSEGLTDSDKKSSQGNAIPNLPHTQNATADPLPFFNKLSHAVSHGESLWRLAKRYYHDPLLWPHIFCANVKLISNPDHLDVGQNIVIPTLEGSPTQLSKRDRQNIAEGYYLTYLYYKKSGHKEAFFALLEAKRYDSNVVKKYRHTINLSDAEEVMLKLQPTMPF